MCTNDITIDDSYKISPDRKSDKIYSAQACDIICFKGARFVVMSTADPLPCYDCDLNINGCALLDYAVICGTYKKMVRASTALEGL